MNEQEKARIQRIHQLQYIIRKLHERAVKNWNESNKAFYAFRWLNGPAVYMKPEKRARLSEVRIVKFQKLLEAL